MKTTLLILLLATATGIRVRAELLDWTSTQGTTIQAELVTTSGDSVILRTAAGKQITLKRSQLDAASQAQIDALTSPPEEDAPAADPADAGTAYKVPTFADGPWKGRHAVYECDKFVAVADQRGVVRIYQKQDGQRVKETVDAYIRPALLHYPEGETQIRRLTRVESKDAPQMQPKKLTFTGEADSGTTFEFVYEFKDDRILSYGSIKDPGGLDDPTHLNLGIRFPAYEKITFETSEGERAAIVGDSFIEGKTPAGETLRYDFLTARNLNQIEAIKNGLTEVRVKSVLCGPRVTRVIAPDAEHGPLRLYNAGSREAYLGFGVSLYRKDDGDRSARACLTVTLE